VVGKLNPGAYELIVYSHQCITNIEQGQLSSFDLLMSMSVRLLRVQAKGENGEGRTPVAVEVLDYAAAAYAGETPRVKEASSAAPMVMPSDEFKCYKEYLKLPDSLDVFSQFGAVDLSEVFYAPTRNFVSQEISFSAKSG